MVGCCGLTLWWFSYLHIGRFDHRQSLDCRKNEPLPYSSHSARLTKPLAENSYRGPNLYPLHRTGTGDVETRGPGVWVGWLADCSQE